MFAADPERYAPQFKGYCALSVARGLKIEADPEAWTIWNGKLFVFGSKDAVPEFKANPGEIADKANATWASLKTNDSHYSPANCRAATIFERCPSSRSCVAKPLAWKAGCA